jgi:hypothetical protein
MNMQNNEETNLGMLTTSIPVAGLRAALALVAAWGAATIAIQWSAFWTLTFSADISGYTGVVSADTFAAIPTVAYALTALVTLAPALLLGYAALPTTPLLTARIMVVASVGMSMYDILTTYLGYGVAERVQQETANGDSAGILTAFGIVMISILASFADEAAIVFFSLAMAYFQEAWLRWKGEPLTFFQSYTALPTLSGLDRLLHGDSVHVDDTGTASRADRLANNQRGNGRDTTISPNSGRGGRN